MSYEVRLFRDWGDAGTDASKGAGIGASVGSIIPGVGTVLGGVAGGLIGGAVGLFQKKKGNALLKQPRPVEQIPQEVLANKTAAESEALTGMPSEQYAQAQKNIQRQQNDALAASQDKRGGLGNLPAIVQQGLDAQGNLDAANGQARAQNRAILRDVNNSVGSWRDKLFNTNEMQKYQDTRNYALGLVGAGNSNFYSGLDKVAGNLLGAYGNGMFNKRGTSGTSISSYTSGGTGLADTSGGSAISPADQYGYLLNPNQQLSGLIGG